VCVISSEKEIQLLQGQRFQSNLFDLQLKNLEIAYKRSESIAIDKKSYVCDKNDVNSSYYITLFFSELKSQITKNIFILDSDHEKRKMCRSSKKNSNNGNDHAQGDCR